MLYNIFILLIQPLVWIRLLWRSKKVPAYRQRWKERYGFCRGKIKPGGIMIHSVSVGETLAAIPLIKALVKLYPSLPLIVTTMTPTGSDQVKSVFEKNIYHVYLPYDLPIIMSRFLRKVNPKLVILMETELWPNLIKKTYQRGIPLVVANARLSTRTSLIYKKFNFFISQILSCITLIAAQSKEDAARFLELGLKKNQLAITGNLKFEISITPELALQAITLRRQWAPHRPIWIAASTHKGEELLLLKVHRKLLSRFSNLLLILVPRHPERFLEVSKITMKAGFNYIMRSSNKIPTSKTQVVIGDTMGELMLLYGIVDLAFIGGSLVNHGGHNPLEAAANAIPILMGPNILNFVDICKKLEKSNGLIPVINATTLVSSISALLIDKKHRLYSGSQALKVLQQNQGALQRLLILLKPYLS
ncbi:3-deoxy-D-manno-octulosonic-acid transferase [secondary endosymbiont of Heteropsylla cubana]|uniref:3-deoxy-D-manno-octulosonic acid transferase n=2 Tax=secondary endosymbiont of Heteropsylla cubana TaxID=134287 RepID=J3VTX7_9ENTR|nr:3-deoxy-D-manno-octulosonic-acid transferase [secondary endosymbiont of Heteropsylla cubana]